MTALFQLKIMNVNRCIKYNYMNFNKELGSSVNQPIPLIGMTNVVDLCQCYGCFLCRRSAKVYVKCSSSSDLNQFKIVKEKPEILLIVLKEIEMISKPKPASILILEQKLKEI